MLDPLISLIAPHTCLACRRNGPLLCVGCLQELLESRADICPACGASSADGLCSRCAPTWPVERALVFGERTGILKTLIDEYKYSHKRSAHRELAEMLSSLLPYGTRACLVPVPTIGRHIRARGYDHMALLARRAARLSALSVSPLLRREADSVQHGATKRERLQQAQAAFALRSRPEPDRLYILLDDITTTGASLKEAARLLRSAGADRIWAVAIARQPLEETLDDR